jgi:hypothetical protein
MENVATVATEPAMKVRLAMPGERGASAGELQLRSPDVSLARAIIRPVFGQRFSL